MKLGQGNIFTSVCLSTRGKGCLPQCMLGCHSPPDQAPPRPGPPDHTPPRADHHPPGPGTPSPREQTTPPWTRHIPPGSRPPPESRLQHTVNEWPVRILLECILVSKLSVQNTACNNFVQSYLILRRSFYICL